VFLVALVTLLAVPVFAPLEAQSSAPETIFIGQFLTLDRSHPQAEAIGVSAGRIVAVGSRSDVEALANKTTRAC
jgi:predicted amidohydrolase YtcJ